MNEIMQMFDMTALDVFGIEEEELHAGEIWNRRAYLAATEGLPSKRCTICKDPAIYHKDEGVWRHRNQSFEGGQFLCDKYGYPIQVEDSLTVPLTPEDCALLLHELDVANEASQFYNRKAADLIILRDADQAELSRLRAERDKWQRAYEGHEKSVQQLIEEAIELRAENEVLRKDKEHVAWLRFRHRGDNQQPYLSVCDSDAPGAFRVYRETNEASICTRGMGDTAHDGPCNGFPRSTCRQVDAALNAGGCSA